MSRFSKALSLLTIVLVFTTGIAGAKTIKLVHSGTAYYASFYLSSSAGSQSFEGKGEGWSHSVNLPESATNIVIKVRTNKFLGAYSDACQSSAGSKGGTFTLSGLLHSESCAFVPNGSTSSVSSISVNRGTMDVLKPNGNSQLFEAVSLKDKATVTELINAGTSHLDTKNRQGLTPLHKAVQLGDSSTVVTLLDAGASTNIVDNTGNDPMMLAITRRKVNIVRAMLQQGVSINRSHLSKAVASRNTQVVETLLVQGAVEPEDVLAEAQKTNQPLMMQLATENGAAVTTASFNAAVASNKVPQAIKYLNEPTSTIDMNEAMRTAIAKNNKPLVKAVLDKGGDPAAALNFGIKVNDATIVNDAVIMHNADPNAALTAVAAKKNAQLFGVLLNAGADANKALALAIPTKDSRMISSAVQAGAQATNGQMKSIGATGDVTLLKTLIQDAGGSADAALEGALSASKWEASRTLITAGAVPQGVVAKAVTAKQLPLLKTALEAGDAAQPGLSPAIQSGNKEIIKVLLQAGASTSDPALVNKVVDQKDPALLSMLLSSGTPADIGMPHAVETQQTAMVKLILDNGADGSNSAYIKASAKTKNLELCKTLLEAGGDANAGIATAVDVNAFDITKLFLSAGADGTSPSLVAASCKHNNASLTSALLKAGAPANAIIEPSINANAGKVLLLAQQAGEDLSGNTYLVKAIRGNKGAIVPILLKAGADATYVDGSGNTMLHLAAANASSGIAQAVKTAGGIDVNSTNQAGDSPLHLAVKRGKTSAPLVEMLISLGSDVNLPNGAGKRPRDLAKSGKVKKLLKKSGAQKSK